MAGFTAAAALLGLVALVYGMVYGVSWLAGVARSPLTAAPFTGGLPPTEHAVSRFYVRWYAITMLFLAFDMEMIFMYPWTRVITAVGGEQRHRDVHLPGHPAGRRGLRPAGGGAPVDVTGLLLRAGATRPHVMIAAMPGGTDVRLAAENQLRRRGWPVALTPADTDVLLVAGTAGPDIAEVVEAAWAAVPAPRARARATRPDDAAPALDAARTELANAADHSTDIVEGRTMFATPHGRGGRARSGRQIPGHVPGSGWSVLGEAP